MKPIMFLDIDDTLLRCIDRDCVAVSDAGSFIRWAQQHFEVRWLTAWAVASMSDQDAVRLAEKHQLGLTSEEILMIPVQSWFGKHLALNDQFALDKTVDFDFEELEQRGFVWVENELLDSERSVLREKGWEDRFFLTNVTANPGALQQTKTLLCQRFGLPA